MANILGEQHVNICQLFLPHVSLTEFLGVFDSYLDKSSSLKDDTSCLGILCFFSQLSNISLANNLSLLKKAIILSPGH